MTKGLKFEWNDEQVRAMIDKWPKRTQWAMKEAMAMTGGHMRKKVRTFIERGGPGAGWPPLSSHWRSVRDGRRGPLYGLAKAVRFKVVGGKTPRTRIGFFTATKRGKTAYNRRERERFKAYFGGTPAALAKKHEFGKRIRITREKRWALIRWAIREDLPPIKKSTKFIRIPARPMIGPVFRRERSGIPDYVGDKFWGKMTSKGGPFR